MVSWFTRSSLRRGFRNWTLTSVIVHIITYRRLAWLIIMGSRFDDWIYWTPLLQLQSLITAHNQWLSATRSIPCWARSVFSSRVTNDERKIPAHTLNCLEGRLSHEWILKSIHGSLYRLVRIHGNSFVTKTCLLKRSLLGNRGCIVACVTMGIA
jgi:hypothetical protein